ncbi:lyase family protein, partial [Marinomonas arenicola]|uniref:lyase family protein n=1 Tax=Marinomonas arenicola TaxID=569601 RepID=UPI00311F1260
ALYGAQTQRAINNFPVSGEALPEAFISSRILIKSAAARANQTLECITPAQSNAIQNASEELLNDPNLMTHFPVDVYQTGSVTSSNMNANEVIATI